MSIKNYPDVFLTFGGKPLLALFSQVTNCRYRAPVRVEIKMPAQQKHSKDQPHLEKADCTEEFQTQKNSRHSGSEIRAAHQDRPLRGTWIPFPSFGRA